MKMLVIRMKMLLTMSNEYIYFQVTKSKWDTNFDALLVNIGLRNTLETLSAQIFHMLGNLRPSVWPKFLIKQMSVCELQHTG